MIRRPRRKKNADCLKDKERSQLAMRALLLFWVFFVVSGLLAVRLFVVQVREGAGLAAYAGQEQSGTFTVGARRGDIVDRFGDVFATSLPSASIAALPREIRNRPHVAAMLAQYLPLSVAQIEASLSSSAARVYVARNVPQDIAHRIGSLGLSGIAIETEAGGRRVDPQQRIGSTVVGFTGIDDQGLSGVEYEYDRYLRGIAGHVTVDTDADGRPIPFGRRVSVPAQPGANVVLTIDRSLQFAAEEALRRAVQRYDAAGGTAIVLRAQTGEVLALANWPNFDPNHWWAASDLARRDQGITDPYEPGSTFKLVTATAALDSGKVSLEDTFAARDAIEVGNRIIHNADDGLTASGHAYETIDDIVAFSHNVGAAQIALRVGKATMFDYIRRFGFDDVTGVDLPGESAGIVGTPDDWWGSRLATIGFGQGVSVTPLALARAYCAIANGGRLMRPYVVSEIVSPSGRVLLRHDPEVVRRVMTPQTAAELLAILRDVVRRGTAKGLTLPGYALAGKTGTAQMVIGGEYLPGAYTASFIGIVPADRPQFVVLVKVDRPHGYYYGSIVAAPAFRELASRVLWREGVAPKHDVATLALPPSRSAGPAGEHAAFSRKRR